MLKQGNSQKTPKQAVCFICGTTFGSNALSSHLKWKHNLSYKNYVDKYLEPDHKCPYCDKDKKWFGRSGVTYMQTCGSKECKSKIYSDHNGGWSETAQDKIKKTCLIKYGSTSFMKSNAFKEKSKQTMLNKYGVDNIMKMPETVDKIRTTCLEKYDKDHIGGNYHILYKNLKFDSRPELLFYLWCKEHHKEVKTNLPGIKYTIDGKIHRYYPDFMVDGVLVEIKGDHLIDDEGFILKQGSHERCIEKTQCMRDHNVRIILSSEVYSYYSPSNKDEVLKECISSRKVKMEINQHV